MNIGILTSSRADYGIYLPLLRKLSQSKDIHLTIFAFGTHVSHFHGYTLNKIIEDNWGELVPVESMVLGDSPEAISTAMGLTTAKFSSIWQGYQKKLDQLICLGDRYEMFAAVGASIPFNIPVCHIHGGESSLGAMDNIFRHCITLMANTHFVSTETYARKVRYIAGEDAHVWNVGALSLDNLQSMKLLSTEEFQKQFDIDLQKPTILTTFHPETKAGERNLQYTDELLKAIEQTRDYQWVITMPNADTYSNNIREKLHQFNDKHDNVIGVENFGTLGYFSIMKHCRFLVGNTSSGILEAASLGKYVVNLGDRQKGRVCSENIIHVPLEKQAILDGISQAKQSGDFRGENVYWNGGASDRILAILSEK